MAGCKCKDKRCVCVVSSGFMIDIDGNGSDRNPYIPNLIPWMLTGLDTTTATTTITGSGTVGSPWVVSMNSTGVSVTQTVFLASGTWTNPGAGTAVRVLALGGGGAGASGYKSGFTENPGAGGTGGAMSTSWYRLADLPGSVPITVGAGGLSEGSGGPAFSGGPGGDSYFGDFLYAPGGRSNRGGGGYPGTVGDGGYGQEGGYLGTPPGSSVLGGPVDLGVAWSGRGGGCGATSTVAAQAGGTASTSRYLIGAGGAGGAVSTNGSPGNLYGAGGGGGAGNSSVVTQYGGDGAQGIVIVTVW